MAKKSEAGLLRLTKDGLLPGVLFALLVRWCVATYPYSGYKTPPMYGDFEAQRHWQEITYHTPAREWYTNTSRNDLSYWGLDYPPLTAYHSYLMGLVADYIEPESVRLFASRGYEKESHKMYMRWTVFLCDLYFYVSAALCLCIDAEKNKGKEKNVFKRFDIGTIMFLLYPGIILIDHGHFQYNCVSLGLFMWAVFFLISIENEVLSACLFALALNYKQMELYHALPFFCYMLKLCFKRYAATSKFRSFVHSLNKLAIAVITMFIISWYPFLRSWNLIWQVVHRLFPLARGIFEDKVANIWCFINVFVKLKHVYTNDEMARISLVLTALAALPSCIDMFLRHNKNKFVLCLINVSLAFFLFSFQVHEKSILLCAIPVALHLPNDAFMCFWFLLVSNFSMLPLLLKDGLWIPFVATNCIYICFYSLCIRLAEPKCGFFSFYNASLVHKCVNKEVENTGMLKLLSLNFFLSTLGMLVLALGVVCVEPPHGLPDLFSLIISVYSCCHFVMFFFYFNYQQMILPSEPLVPKVKKNN